MPTRPYTELLYKDLQNAEFAGLYLNEVLEHESREVFLIALRHVIEARNLTFAGLAERLGMSRQGLMKALSEDGNPRLSTLQALLRELGLQLQVGKGERSKRTA